MKRLTTKSENIEDMYLVDIHNVQEAIDKLGVFEDFMEDNGFDSFEEFKKHFEVWNSEDDEAFIKDTDKWKLWAYRFAKNRFRYEVEQNKCLQDKWNKLKEIISNKQHIKDKATDFVTLLGASGVEVFCEMLLKEMEKLEEQN